MAIGCPVLAGEIKPIIETAGGAVVILTAKKIEDISQKLELFYIKIIKIKENNRTRF